MAERLVLSVDPSPSTDGAKVQDVFLHVLDLFDLLSQNSDQANDVVAWRLVSVSMNSPLTIVAEAVAVRPTPTFNLDVSARMQKREFARNVIELKHGRVPDAWRGSREVKRVARAFSSSKPTKVKIDTGLDDVDLKAVVIEFSDLPIVEKAIEAAAIEAAPKPKEQVGSLEGRLIDVGLFYNKPAVKLLERKTNQEVWCIVPDSSRLEIARSTTFEDVWAGRRVLVEGTMSYDRSGLLTKIVATSVHVIDAASVDVTRIADPAINNGLSAREYLERFREGTLG